MSRQFYWVLVDEDGDYVVFSDAADVARMPSPEGGLAYSGSSHIEKATHFDLLQALAWGCFQGWCVRPVAGSATVSNPWSSPIDARVLRALATAMGVDVASTYVDPATRTLARVMAGGT